MLGVSSLFVFQPNRSFQHQTSYEQRWQDVASLLNLPPADIAAQPMPQTPPEFPGVNLFNSNALQLPNISMENITGMGSGQMMSPPPTPLGNITMANITQINNTNNALLQNATLVPANTNYTNAFNTTISK